MPLREGRSAERAPPRRRCFFGGAACCERPAAFRRRLPETAPRRRGRCAFGVGALFGRLGPACGLGHDDLVHAQDGDGGVDGEAQRRLLDVEDVVDRRRRRVGGLVDGLRVDVHARGHVARGVRGAQLGEHQRRVEARVLGQRARDDLKGFGELFDGVLLEARAAVAVRHDLPRQLQLAGAGAVDEARVLADGAHRVHRVVDGPLDVVEQRVRRRTEHDGRNLRRVPGRLLEDGDHLAADLAHARGGDEAQLLGRRRPEADEGRGARGAAEAPQLPLRDNLQGHELVLLQEVQRHLGDGAPDDDELGAAGVDCLDDLLERALLRLVVVQELLGRADEDGALGLRLRHLEAAVEDGDLCVLQSLDRSLRVTAADHALHHGRVANVAAADLRHTDLVRL
mmetsp:Transcript_31354/g.105599  ORF Transcript_31354/g.105599 Transcript_31354/m.105599 type:complete len:397 (-) Transcript_31354:681-1871(-)